MKIEIDFDAVEPGETAFGEAPEGFDAVDVSSTFGERFLFVDADVLVEADVDQAVIPGPAVGANDARRIDATPDHRSQRGLRAILDDFGVNLALAFEDAKDGLLERASATQAGQRPTAHPTRSKVAFVDLHDALEVVALPRSLERNHDSKPRVQRIDRLAIDLQQVGGLGGCQIETKAFQNLFDPVIR